MKIPTLFLPGFSHRLCGSRARTVARGLGARADQLDGLVALVAKFIPAATFAPAAEQRDRVYTPWVTFIAFLGQALARGSACRESVRRVQAWCVALKRTLPDENTSAYCQARGQLSLAALQTAHEKLGDWIESRTKEAWQWCGRPVSVLDGCGLSMPDSDENRARWPYAGGQKPGCGFPTAQLVGLFSLSTGRSCASLSTPGKPTRFPRPESCSTGSKRIRWCSRTAGSAAGALLRSCSARASTW